ncbi:MAG: nucleotidyl transferase AbiEii/AbiGii toxin family protein [Prolixibacteraceae bacterium]|nr:nucleotidyl transferase AbiEii/AbiGii toxin family protein [Prolixibacteraceae bacterium]
MLHTEAIEPGTFSLLKELMDIPELKPFSLVGGTALALRYGHRNSIDLDLFSHIKFEPEFIEKELRQVFGKDYHTESGHQKIGIFCFIKKIKVDIIHYPFQLVSPVKNENGIRIYSDADIAAMKVQAILGRGKKKDFWDLHELLQHYSLQQLIDWHKLKYPNQMLAISIPNAITYFVDTDDSETPVSYKGQTWEKVKKEISRKVSDYLR